MKKPMSITDSDSDFTQLRGIDNFVGKFCCKINNPTRITFKIVRVRHKDPGVISWGYHFDVQFPQRSVGSDLDISFDAIMCQDRKETREAGVQLEFSSLENWR